LGADVRLPRSNQQQTQSGYREGGVLLARETGREGGFVAFEDEWKPESGTGKPRARIPQSSFDLR
jgi:hypothetical protein